MSPQQYRAGAAHSTCRRGKTLSRRENRKYRVVQVYSNGTRVNISYHLRPDLAELKIQRLKSAHRTREYMVEFTGKVEE